LDSLIFIDNESKVNKQVIVHFSHLEKDQLKIFNTELQ